MLLLVGYNFIHTYFVCVDDVCEMHYRMIDNPATGIFNIGTSDPISFRDVADIVKANSHCTIKEIPMPKELKGQYQTER